MRKYISTIGLACAALIAAGSLAALMTTAGAAAEDNNLQVSKLLSAAKTESFQLREDADQLWMFAHVTESASSANQISVDSQEQASKLISSDINAIVLTLAKLDSARKTAAPWQQSAIDQIRPLVKELAANTTAVIDYIHKNPNRLHSAEYREYVEANSDDAAQLSSLIGAFVDYGKAKERLDRLSGKLPETR
jgi:hypothetical protein